MLALWWIPSKILFSILFQEIFKGLNCQYSPGSFIVLVNWKLTELVNWKTKLIPLV